jgi:uncharacterized membrane protein
MKQATFSIREAIEFGWAIVKEQFWLLIGIIVVSGLFSALPDIVERGLDMHGVSLAFVEAGSLVMGFILDAGMVWVMLRLHDGKSVKLTDVFSQYPVAFRFFVAEVLYVLMILCGLILFVVPGIYLAVRYQFYKYFLVDKSMDIVASFKRSATITEGHRWQLFVFGFALLGLNILGILCLLVGILVTIPISMLALVFVYRKLSGAIEEKEPLQAEKVLLPSMTTDEAID